MTKKIRPMSRQKSASKDVFSSVGETSFYQNQTGDLVTENRKKKNTSRKGSSKRPFGYSSWAQMKQRCTNPKNDGWDDYGGRGISYCDEWETFEGFMADMGAPPSTGDTLDRIDPDGNYEPNNCRWATKVEQARNRRNTRRVEYDGQAFTLAELAERYGVPLETLANRLKTGMTVEAALHVPVTRGGDRSKTAMLGSKFNCWPETLPDATKSMLEAEYKRELSSDDRNLTRPQYFLERIERQVQRDIENYWEAPPDQRDPNLEKGAVALERVRLRAVELCKNLGVPWQPKGY